MSIKNMINDAVDDIEIKPSKSKLILKWVVRASTVLIGGAFVFGQLKMVHLNRLGGIENSLNKQEIELKEFHQEYRQGQEKLNMRIDKVYDDATNSFNSFQESNQKQLELIIDYSGENKELLKKMLEINAMERQQSIERQLETAKNEKPKEYSIVATPISQKTPRHGEAMFIEMESGDTIFSATGLTQKFVDKIDKKLYVIVTVRENEQNHELFNVTYKNR